MDDKNSENNAKKVTMHIVIPLELREKLDRMAINQERVRAKVIERLIRMADESGD